MLTKPNVPIVTLEEHYWDEELAATFTGYDQGAPPETRKRLLDVSETRLAAMDEAGIEGVPCFIFGGLVAVQGAQAPEKLASAIAQAAEAYAKRHAAE